ncbi:hypothetical protein JMG10_50100, partial [Nostoc ellipsosporum NOK]|nr:hypothetical protein [Nostoc ellipsosporum NOK]
MTTALALSVGDPSGIGPEIAIAAFLTRAAVAVPAFYLLADPALMASRARHLGVSLPIQEVTPAQAAAVFGQALPIVPLAA